MKKLLFILFVSVCFSVSGQFISEFEVGHKSYKNRLITDESNRFKLDAFYSKFYNGYQYKRFKVITETSIFFNKSKKTKYFTPEQAEFIFSLSYSFKRFEFSFSHLCVHPIVGQMNEFKEGRKFFESYDKISVKVKLY